MKDFTGKKLLVLGGIMRTTFLIERAKRLGVYVIVADMDKNSPGKKIADKAILVNALDVDALEMIAMEEQVDGVISAHTDLLLRPWYELAKRLNVPCYLTEDMIEMSTDKEKFTSICMKYDVPVPKIFELDEKRLDEEAKNLKYPVFIKPLDGSGARGASSCEKRKILCGFMKTPENIQGKERLSSKNA